MSGTMLTENATINEIHNALSKAIATKPPRWLKDRKWRAALDGEKTVSYWQTIPKTDQVMMVTCFLKERNRGIALMAKGREGYGIIVPRKQNQATVITSHAIRRYFNRHEHIPEEVCSHLNDIDPTRVKEVMKEIILKQSGIVITVKNKTETEEICHYNGGIFLIEKCGDVAKFRTFIMNRQTYPNQRMMSLAGEKMQEDVNLKTEKYGVEKTRISFEKFIKTQKTMKNQTL